MKEKLIIKNFAGIDHLEIELNKINILIGPQASGKSITAKLFFYFKSFTTEIRRGIENKKTKAEIDKNYLSRFASYFPQESWSKGDFLIEYQMNNTWMKIERERNKTLKFVYSNNIKLVINQGKIIYENEMSRTIDGISKYKSIDSFTESFNNLVTKKLSVRQVSYQYFIPAGRSFFSNIQSSLFSFINSKQSLDPFLVEFGSFYEVYKDLFDTPRGNVSTDFVELLFSILHSSYVRENEKDILLHSDNRKVNLINSSSGQQEILPLLITLKVFMEIQISGVLYIEEPEAHLFPNAQKNIIQLLTRVFNSGDSNYQIIITTHSPYILSSFNNLMYAGSLDEKLDASKIKKLNKLIPKEERIDPKLVSAYSLDLGGKKKNLIDRETGLISQNYLDDVSNKISAEFGKLLDLEF